VAARRSRPQSDWWHRLANENVISCIPLAVRPVLIFDITNASLSKTSQWISLKFDLNPFRVKVVLLANFRIGLLSGFGGVMENKKVKKE